MSDIDKRAAKHTDIKDETQEGKKQFTPDDAPIEYSDTITTIKKGTDHKHQRTDGGKEATPSITWDKTKRIKAIAKDAVLS
jgi:hypothetical protein